MLSVSGSLCKWNSSVCKFFFTCCLFNSYICHIINMSCPLPLKMIFYTSLRQKHQKTHNNWKKCYTDVSFKIWTWMSYLALTTIIKMENFLCNLFPMGHHSTLINKSHLGPSSLQELHLVWILCCITTLLMSFMTRLLNVWYWAMTYFSNHKWISSS